MSERSRRAWRWGGRILFGAFLLAVGALLLQQARKVDWPAVGETLLSLSPSTLALAVALTIVSYLLYGSFDLLGRYYVGHRIARWRLLAIGATSYAFNLNIGALVGSAGFRYRLYSRNGLSTADTTRVIALSISGNWSGYLVLAGLLLSVQRLEVPEQWALGAHAMQGLGMLMLATAAAYPLLCAFSPRRQWSLRGHVIELPSLRIAALQMLLSSANWLLIATILWLLLPPIGFANVLGALLIAAVAGAIAHIPAGLGVLEAVFVTLFADSVGSAALIAGLMGYRGIYYLLPLLVAIGLYVTLERQPAQNAAGPSVGKRATAKNRGPGIAAGAPAHPDEG